MLKENLYFPGAETRSVNPRATRGVHTGAQRGEVDGFVSFIENRLFTLLSRSVKGARSVV